MIARLAIAWVTLMCLLVCVVVVPGDAKVAFLAYGIGFAAWFVISEAAHQRRMRSRD